jgi:hypothetical protein
MPKPRVYVETTIPSFYYESRIATDIVARRDWTRQWCDGPSERYALFTSAAAHLTGRDDALVALRPLLALGPD